MDGDPVDPTHVHQSRLGYVLRKYSPYDLKSYQDHWTLCFNYAISISDRNSLTYNRNPYNRFYKLPGRLTLYIVPGQSFQELSKDKWLTALKEAASSDGNVIPKLIDPKSAKENGYICLSSNPLGLYSTWIKPDDLEDLASYQTGSSTRKWAQKPPPTKAIRSFNSQLINSGKQPKSDYIGTTSQWSLLQWPGQTVRYYKRLSTESVMGGSANKVYNSVS
jgi:hypothetical protein